MENSSSERSNLTEARHPPISANALPFIPTGSQIDFNGGIDPIGGANVYNATGLGFRASGNPYVFGTPGTLGLANTAQGAFTAFFATICPSAAAGGCGTITSLTSFNVATESLNTPALPVLDFLTFTQGGQSVTFTLNNFSITDVQSTGTSLGTLSLSGSGEIDYQGYTPTNGIVTITAQGPGSTSFSGSLVSLAAPVPTIPEPGSIVMLGMGVLALSGVAYRRRNSLGHVTHHTRRNFCIRRSTSGRGVSGNTADQSLAITSPT